jgi:hypothetical protein
MTTDQAYALASLCAGHDARRARAPRVVRWSFG